MADLLLLIFITGLLVGKEVLDLLYGETIFADEPVEASAALAGRAGEALQQILQAVDTVNQQVNRIAASTQDLSSHSQSLITSIEQIAEISQENRTAAEHMTDASYELRSQMKIITDSTQTLRELARSLQSLLA